MRAGQQWPDARRSARGNQIARLQGHKLTNVRDYNIHAEHHLRNGRLLFGFAVDDGPDHKLFEIDVLAGNHRRPYGAESIESLTSSPLSVLALQVACSDVVYTGITKHISGG